MNAHELACVLVDVGVVRDGAVALSGVNISVRRGERLAIVGPSGAGKSTLLSLLSTVAAPTSGIVTIHGVDPCEASAEELRRVRRRIASLHQSVEAPGALRVIHNVNAGRLGEWSTARSLLSLVRPRDIEIVRSALGQLGIADKLWERTDRLSGGERQRVGVARLLVCPAELMLADEPVAALDPARADDVVQLLTNSAQARGATVIVSLHQFDLALRYFDRVIGLRSGRVLFDVDAASVDAAHRTDLYELVAE